MKDLSIIFPVYNEQKTIQKTINEWKMELKKHNFSYELILCEDGSTDGTIEVLTKLTSKYKYKLLSSNRRLGYGTALINGIRCARSRWILHVDSDGQCDPSDFTYFWKNRHTRLIIMGYRTKRNDPNMRIMFSILYKKLFAVLLNIKKIPPDPSCPYVLYSRKDVLPYLQFLSFMNEGFWWGFSAVVQLLSLSIMYIPINHRLRSDGYSRTYTFRSVLIIFIKNTIGLCRIRSSIRKAQQHKKFAKHLIHIRNDHF